MNFSNRILDAINRTSKSPSHVEEFRSAILAEVVRASDTDKPLRTGVVLRAIERYDRAKAGPWEA